MLCERSHKHSSATATCSGKNQSGSGKANQFSCSLITFISKQSHLGIDMCAHHFWLYKQRCKTFGRRVRRDDWRWALVHSFFALGPDKMRRMSPWNCIPGPATKRTLALAYRSCTNYVKIWNQTSILTIHDLMCCRSVYLQCICMAKWRNNTLPIKGALIIQLVNVDRIKHGFTLQNRRRNAYSAMQKHNNCQVLIKVAFPCNTHNLGKKQTTLKKCYNHPTCLKLLRYQDITGPPMEP